MYKRPDVYPNGTTIPKSLPSSYQPASYGNAPPGENCFSCHYYDMSTMECGKWNAPVRPRWWCEAWETQTAKMIPIVPVKPTQSSSSGVYKKITTTVEEIFEQEKSKSENEEDVISVNVPLMIRLLEYAREDAKKDADLHTMAENMVELCEEGETLSMKDYYDIVKC